MSDPKRDLVRVEQYSELGAGVRVEVRGCGRCGETHGGILLVLLSLPVGFSPSGRLMGYTGWDLSPLPNCTPETMMLGPHVVPIAHCLIGPDDVATGKVWRWVDFDGNQLEERNARHDIVAAEIHGAVEREKEKVRAR